MAREIAQTHGVMTTTNAITAKIEQSARPFFRLMAYGMAMSIGTAIATGPFVNTPNAMAAQATIVAPRDRSSIANQKAMMAATMKKLNLLSKITVRENASASGIDTNA